MNKIEKIYHLLISAFGGQGWWPVTPIGGCKGGLSYKPIYGIALKNEKQKLEIIFGAILTQNTSWKNVEKAMIELNKENLIDVDKILKIEKGNLAKIIKSSGYHNQKAEKLKIFSDFLSKKYNNNLKKFFKKNIKALREELLSIKGIGPETADSVILYAAEKPIFVVDAYTKRIMQRIGFKERTYDELQGLFMKSLERDHKLFNEYHALLVELGKNYCKKRPLCAECPVNEFCSKIL